MNLFWNFLNIFEIFFIFLNIFWIFFWEFFENFLEKVFPPPEKILATTMMYTIYVRRSGRGSIKPNYCPRCSRQYTKYVTANFLWRSPSAATDITHASGSCAPAACTAAYPLQQKSPIYVYSSAGCGELALNMVKTKIWYTIIRETRRVIILKTRYTLIGKFSSKNSRF